jgi:predicted metalloprotease with PDZ domain
MADLLPHEFTHSWNGKYRRPADLWTPSFEVPMRTSLLWVYEGQTEYWGKVLSARSGLVSVPTALEQLAVSAAAADAQKGREWRSLADTTDDPIYMYKSSPARPDWQRGGDYYAEGALVWLDVDTLIRERTNGAKSLDDFARIFFGDRSDSQIISTYSFEDVVSTLNKVAPYDWAAFLRARLDGHGPGAPLDGLARGGYRLAYSDTPTAYFKALEARDGVSDLTYSIGISVTTGGKIRAVCWDGVASRAGLMPDDSIEAVNGELFSADGLTRAITTATQTGTIDLTVKSGRRMYTVAIPYKDGLRYPRLERIPGTSDRLSAIYRARRS